MRPIRHPPDSFPVYMTLVAVGRPAYARRLRSWNEASVGQGSKRRGGAQPRRTGDGSDLWRNHEGPLFLSHSNMEGEERVRRALAREPRLQEERLIPRGLVAPAAGGRSLVIR